MGVDKVKPARRRRQQTRGGGGNTVGIMVIVLIVVGLAVYFGAAGVVGNWLAEHVVSPVLSKLGLWESTDLPAVESPVASNAQQAGEPNPTDTAVVSQGIQANMLGMNAYFLQTGAFELEGNASAEAAGLQSKGGAGYVAEDGSKFRVFISTYSERADAESVRDKLTGEGVESRVHVLESPAKNMAVSTDAQKAALESASQKYIDGVNRLHEASMAIEDSAKSSEHAAAAAVEFQAVRTELDKGFASGENEHADELYEIAGSVAEELLAGSATQSAIQHAYARACFEYAMLLAEIQ